MSISKAESGDLSARTVRSRPVGQVPLPPMLRSRAAGRAPISKADDASRSRALADITSVAFLLVPSFSMIAFSSAIEPLRLANRIEGQDTFSWRVLSADGKPVAASNGVELAVHGSFADLGGATAAIVCSGVDVQTFDHRELIARLRGLASRGVPVGAVCTGTYVLAKAGLLDDHRCTVHWENQDSLREQFPEIDVTEELFEIDRTRFTCAGGTAAIDMMLALIARQLGQEVASGVTDQLIHHRMRDGDERQRMELRSRLGVAHPKLISVVAEMESCIEQPLSCVDLAEGAGLSTRQLERLFRKYIGQVPTRYYLGLRLTRARQLLLQTSMPILSIGLACGFVSASHFSKCYSEHFDRTPSQERRTQR
ncbi:MAG: GlxA family transcriptional regulator [Janthinobacterium lividum]